MNHAPYPNPRPNATPTATPRTHPALRLLRRVGVFAVVLYVAWCAVLFVMQGTLIFPRSLIPPTRVLLDGQVGSDVTLLADVAPNGDARAAMLVRSASPRDEKAPLLVFFHGNAELIDDNVDFAREYAARGMHVLMPEFRGYGRSTGSPSQAAIVEDAMHFLDQALARPEVDASRIVLHGRSLGGGVAFQVAERLRQRDGASALRGIVLESTFTSIASFASGYGVPGFIVRSPFRSDLIAPTVRAPILILHATADHIVPIEHGRELARLAPTATLVELQGGHFSFPNDPVRTWKAIDAFLLAHAFDRAQ